VLCVQVRDERNLRWSDSVRASHSLLVAASVQGATFAQQNGQPAIQCVQALGGITLRTTYA